MDRDAVGRMLGADLATSLFDKLAVGTLVPRVYQVNGEYVTV